MTLVALASEIELESSEMAQADSFVCSCGHSLLRPFPPLTTNARPSVTLPVFPPIVLLAPKPKLVLSKPAQAVASNQKIPITAPALLQTKPKQVKQTKKTEKKKASDAGWKTVGKPSKKIETKSMTTKSMTPAPKSVGKKIVVEQEVLPVGWVDEKAEKKRLKRQRRIEAEINRRIDEKRLLKTKQAVPKQAVPQKKAVVSIAKKSKQTIMGSFKSFPNDLIVYILRMLDVSEIISCGLVSKGFNRASRMSSLWRDLHSQSFANSLVPRGALDFHHHYMLRRQGIVSELVCFHTRLSLQDDSNLILGYGIQFTRNPRTGELDYLNVARELISNVAFDKLKVRVGAHGEEIQGFLPLYLTLQHSQRTAWPESLKRVAKLCCPNLVLEEALIKIITVALNTQTVLLADKGVVAADSAFKTYSQLHRLMLALANELPMFKSICERRVSDFLSNNHKSSVPSLGEFIPLLLVTSNVSWKRVCGPLVKEVLARNVLWAGRNGGASLASASSSMGTMERINGFWEATKVSNRLLLLSNLFLTISSSEASSWSDTARVLDRFYGNPTATQLQLLRRKTALVLSDKCSYRQFFPILLGQSFGPSQVESLLKEACKMSRRAGYTSSSTNFSRVMKSGVSKILRKGESYTTANDVNDILLTLGWQCPRGTIFLDASLICFDNSLNFIQGSQIDYDNPVNPILGESVMHSGDQIRGTQGEHNILISLRKIPLLVDSFYLILSAWTQDLSVISQPFVKLVDTKAPELDLCRYQIESAGNAQCVVMARVKRAMQGGWKVEALGVTSPGTVRSYKPILNTISNINRVAMARV